MNIIGRLKNERVIIYLPDGRTITVTVVDILLHKVKLQFDADRDIGVEREDIYNQRLVDPEPPDVPPPSLPVEPEAVE